MSEIKEKLTYHEQQVIELRRKYSLTWRDLPEGNWSINLMEEMLELLLSLKGQHEHSPDTELTQIAAICINWLEMRGAA